MKIPIKKSKTHNFFGLLSSALVFVLLVSLFAFTEVTQAVGDGTVDSTVEINDLTANGPVLLDDEYFGYAVANIGDLDNDGVDDFVVSVPYDSIDGAYRGAVYILFMNTDGSVDSNVKIDDATINGPALSDIDIFGASVAGLGDLNGDMVEDIAVGAQSDDAGGNSRGAVHILFLNTDGSVDSTVEINDTTVNGPALSDIDIFGYAVANIGDLNNDGVVDLAVGAQGADGTGSDRGAAYIMFMNTDGSVDSTVEINDTTVNGPVLSDGDGFGSSIAGLGDLNGDMVEDIAVGAYTDDAGGADRGTVHVLFLNTDGSVDSTVEINDATLNGPIVGDSEFFGISVASIGDLNGDGVTDLAAGASSDSEGGANRGTVHVLFLNTDGSVDSTVEINDSTLNGPVLEDSDNFGYSIANIGDLDSNGVDDLAVGAVGDDAGGSGRGAVHIIYLHNEVTSSGGGSSPQLIKPEAPKIFVGSVKENSAKVSIAYNAGSAATSELGFTITTEDLETPVYSYSNKVSNPQSSSSTYFVKELKCDTTYVLIDYAKNSRYTTYSNEVEFTTNTCSGNEASVVEPVIPAEPLSQNLEGHSAITIDLIKQETLKATQSYPVRDLFLGLVGGDVQALQRFLNANGFNLATSGVGSSGQETTFFGRLTQNALIKFQQAKQINPAKGYFGNLTRKVIIGLSLPGTWW